ncbi:hypothetical protein HMPREF1985_02286 [Mitsuokella sp. oral taxon 131 str. W9106]|nr:hypothetical protein HMPREF1985_02286 [Mitsuokella sp. oral taxon 131 str. W9106]
MLQIHIAKHNAFSFRIYTNIPSQNLCSPIIYHRTFVFAIEYRTFFRFAYRIRASPS